MHRRLPLTATATCLAACYVYQEPLDAYDLQARQVEWSSHIDPDSKVSGPELVASAEPLPPIAPAAPIEPDATQEQVATGRAVPAAGGGEDAAGAAGEVRCVAVASTPSVIGAAILSGDAPDTRLDLVVIEADGSERARADLWAPDGGPTPACPAIVASSDGSSFDVVAFDVGARRDHLFAARVGVDGTVQYRAGPHLLSEPSGSEVPSIVPSADGTWAFFPAANGGRIRSATIDRTGALSPLGDLGIVADDVAVTADAVAWRLGTQILIAPLAAGAGRVTASVALQAASGSPAVGAAGGGEHLVVSAAEPTILGRTAILTQLIREGRPAGAPGSVGLRADLERAPAVAARSEGWLVAFVADGHLWTAPIEWSGALGAPIDLGAVSSTPSLVAFGDGFVVAASTAEGTVFMRRLDARGRPLPRRPGPMPSPPRSGSPLPPGEGPGVRARGPSMI